MKDPGRFLPSDLITCYRGVTGVEPREFDHWHTHALVACQGGETLHVCFNTGYPELSGGYFLNRNLIAVVQESMLACGLEIVIEDIADSEQPPPREIPGCLQEKESYVIVGNEKVVGHALAWQFHAGGGGRYADDFVFSVVTDSSRIAKLIHDIKEKLAGKARFIDATSHDPRSNRPPR